MKKSKQNQSSAPDGFEIVTCSTPTLTAEECSSDKNKSLWLFRAPLDFPASALNDIKLKLKETDLQSRGKVLKTMEVEGNMYEVKVGDSVSAAQLIHLLPSKADPSKLLTVKSTFTQIEIIRSSSPNEVEPLSSEAKPNVITAYSAVPQKTGMVVRFTPFGYGSVLGKRDVAHEVDRDDDDKLKKDSKKKKKKKNMK